MQPKALLFLDVDGVLHRLNGRTFERLPVLVHWLRLRPNVELVLSSSTREYGGRERFSAALPVDLRPRLVSQTPLLRHALGANPLKYVRQREILQWLETAGVQDVPYAVLDDDAGLFEPAWSPLVLCSPSVALKTKNLQSLESKFKVHVGNTLDRCPGFVHRLGAQSAPLGDNKALDVSMSKLPIASLRTSLPMSEVVSLLREGDLGSTELPSSQY